MAGFQSFAIRPRKNWSHPILFCDLKAHVSCVMIGSSGVGHVGGAIRVRSIHLIILSQIRLAIMSGVCCLERFCRKVVNASVRAVHRVSLGHLSMWLVSSHSRLHSKHRPSIVLSIVCCRFNVGSRSFMYLDSCIRWPTESFLKDSLSGCHAMES